jgi:uncharacterized protein DUF2867
VRLPNSAHTSRPWRIHELTHDFRLEDVWALPTPGGKPNGRLGTVYMAAIRPFRRLIVYPALLRQIERQWRTHAAE